MTLDFEKINYLLIGGAGFIGSHCARILANSTNNIITIYDNFCVGREWHIADIADQDNVNVIKADIEHSSTLGMAMKDVDIVYHFAANADIAKAMSEPTIDFWQGTVLTQYVLEAMRKCGVSHMIFTSGSGVYGDLGDEPVIENRMARLPISPYGAAKLGSEALIASYSHMFGIQAIIYRFANVIGPYQTHGVGYDFVKQLLKNPSSLRIMGDGNQCKSYLYVDDVIDAITFFNNFDLPPINVFNVATNDYITVREIADIVVDELGLYNVSYDCTGGTRGWKGDIPKVVFNTEKLREMGWSNNHTSADAMRLAVRSLIMDAKAGRFDDG
jgi:UDP-glucose 4-epimerase|tara:strand:+ start:1320 stop:2306 length:987 start_codon:yes stop_codon:yes gene_type:complete